MKNKQISVQKCGIKILQIAVFVFAFYLIQTTANAQVAFGKPNQIKSVFSGKCILASGEEIIQMDCDKDLDPFTFQFAGGETFQIKSKGVDKCIDVPGSKTGNR